MKSKSPAKLSLPQPIAWMGIRAQLPEDWQPTRHGVNPQRGTLIFVDRRRQCLQVSWTITRTRPDVLQMIEDYRSASLREDEDAVFTDYEVGDRWQGLVRWEKQRIKLIRAVHYVPAHRLTLELTLNPERLWLVPGGQESDDPVALSRQLLARWHSAEPPMTARRWRLLDLDVQIPEHWRLTSMRAALGDVQFRFRRHTDPASAKLRDGKPPPAQPTRDELIVRRRTMASVFHRGEMHRYIKRQDDHAIYHTFSRTFFAGQQADTSEGIEAGKRIRRLTGKLRRKYDLAFKVDREDAVYHLTALIHRRSPQWQWDQLRVTPAHQTVRFDEDRSDAQAAGLEASWLA